MASNYWTQLLDNKMSRRRALVGTGAGALGAAFLAACGGGGGKSGAKSGDGTDKSSLITKPEDTTKLAKRGGILKDRLTADAPTMDPQGPIAPLNIAGAPRLQHPRASEGGLPRRRTATDIVPRPRESWETSPDGLHDHDEAAANAKWHNKAPVNGRAFDSSDVLFSWNRYAAKRAAARPGRQRGQPAGAGALHDGHGREDRRDQAQGAAGLRPGALRLLRQLHRQRGDHARRRRDNGFDIRSDMIGTGPYYPQRLPAVGRLHLKRNPDYWDQNANFVDQINYPIVAGVRAGPGSAQGRQHPPLQHGRRSAPGEHLHAQEGRAPTQHLPRRPAVATPRS